MTFYNRNGNLYVRLDGKRISTKLKDTPNNRKMVESYHKNDKFFKKFNVTTNVPTVVELCEEVLLEKFNSVKRTSYNAYESLFNSRIQPFFENRLINEIRPLHIKEFYDSFTDRSTLNTCDSILREAFQKAIIYEFIESTPLIVKRPKFKSNYQMKPFTLDEINLIIRNAPKMLKNFLGVAFYTGLRTGEIIGLQWEDINFNEYTISVNRTITSGLIQTPKTESSRRVIDMLTQTEEFLHQQRKATGLSEYVFLNNSGKHYRSTSNFGDTWKRLLNDLNLEYRNIYQTRHSFASNMLSNKEDIMWVSSMLGHKSANITLDKYSRYIKKEKSRKNTFLDSDTKVAQNS